MRKKRLLFLTAFLAIAVPVLAISYGKDLNRTLRVLRNELEADYRQIDKNRERLTEDYEKQHQKMIDVMKQCDELSLMLYSQKQGFTFDVSYALQKVTEKYNEFNQDRGPFDHIVSNLNVEMERHARLIESLRRLPPGLDTIVGIPDSLLIHYDTLNPLYFSVAHLELDEEVKAMADSLSMVPFVLDEQGESDREQCIFYAGELLKMYAETKAVVVADSIHYYETFLRQGDLRLCPRLLSGAAEPHLRRGADAMVCHPATSGTLLASGHGRRRRKIRPRRLAVVV